MLALRFDSFGDPDVLDVATDLPDPVPSATEAVIRYTPPRSTLPM